jgi:orotate phosphoribosyltransferase
MVLKRGYGKVVKGKRVLVLDDILTTGTSARRTVAAVRDDGGFVVGVGCICNRSGGAVTADTLDVPQLQALLDLDLVTYAEDDCPLCRGNVPVNVEVGHGKEFLVRQSATAW